MRRVSEYKEGFTLLEVSFGLALLSLISVSVMATIVTCTRSQNYLREHDSAREAVRGKLEEVIAWSDFSNLTARFDGQTFAADSLTGPAGADDPPGRVTVTGLRTDLARVDVRVEWQSPEVGNHFFELSTYVANGNATALVGP